MPDIRHKETVETLAHNYCTNGFNKARAMIDAGFAESYAMSGRGQEVYKKTQVKAAILTKMEEIRGKSEDKIEHIRKLHEAGVALSLEKGDLVNFTRNVEGLGRTYGSYTDNINTADTTEQRKLSEKEELEARRIASIMLYDSTGEAKEA